MFFEAMDLHRTFEFQRIDKYYHHPYYVSFKKIQMK